MEVGRWVTGGSQVRKQVTSHCPGVRPILWKNGSGRSLPCTGHGALSAAWVAPWEGFGARGHTCQSMGTYCGVFLCRVGACACGGSSGTGLDCLLLQGRGDAATQGGIHTQSLALGSLGPRGESSLPLQGPSAPGACGRAAQAAGGQRRPSALGRLQAAVLAKSGAGTTGGGSVVWAQEQRRAGGTG